MFVTATVRKQPVRTAFEGLRKVYPFTVLTRRRARAVGREMEADLDRTSLRLHDELGLLSDEGCVTDWGLLERAERLRSGWS